MIISRWRYYISIIVLVTQLLSLTLTEDDCYILNRKLQYIRPGMIITVIYYNKGQYVQLEGKVSKINLDTKIIQIVNSKISLKSIVDIRDNDIFE